MNQPPSGPNLGQPARPGFFAGRGGFFGGLLGAGLLGMLLGYGMFGGMGGLGSILGLLLQIGLVVILVRLAIRFFQRRNQPAYAGASAPVPPLRREAPRPTRRRAGRRARPRVARSSRSPRATWTGSSGRWARSRAPTAHGISRRWTGWPRPRSWSFLAEELGQDERRGVVNHIADVKLLQGDVAESWREQGQDYATVALRFGLRDWTTDKATGAVVEGDPERPIEATELWTFVRPRGGEWRLSAIQQG